MSQAQRIFVIDSDTAADAVALMMALRTPDVQVVAITTVAGNVNVEQTTRNALTVVERAGAGVLVYLGLAKPLLHPANDAAFFHGTDSQLTGAAAASGAGTRCGRAGASYS